MGLSQRGMNTPYPGSGARSRTCRTVTRRDPPAPRPLRTTADAGSAGRSRWYPPAPLPARLELRGVRQAEPTHSSVPSAKNWCFHTGSRALTVSTSSAHVSNAAARWSAATAATRAASPICSVPTRWLTAIARTP